MSMISREILRKVNNLRKDINKIYTFKCDGQEFHILTPEQLKLLFIEYGGKGKKWKQEYLLDILKIKVMKGQ